MERLKNIDALRGIGVISVILIHLTSTYANSSTTSYAYLIWGGINQFLGFAVPLFLLISALLMTYKANENKTISIKKFYAKRLPRVIVALFIWTTVYLVYLNKVGTILNNEMQITWDFVSKYILSGQACYHLYFIPIIVQLYLIFPFIFLFAKMFERIKINFYLNFVVWFIVLALIQWLFLKIHQFYIWENFKNPAIILASYILPVGMGTWLGFNIKEFNRKHIFFSLCILIATLGVGYWYINGQLFNYKIYIRLLPVLYKTMATLSLIILVKYIKQWSLLLEISKKSFFIYLIHPFIMYILEIDFEWKMQEFTKSFFVNYSLDIVKKFIIVTGISYLTAFLWECLCKLFKVIQSKCVSAVSQKNI